MFLSTKQACRIAGASRGCLGLSFSDSPLTGNLKGFRVFMCEHPSVASFWDLTRVLSPPGRRDEAMSPKEVAQGHRGRELVCLSQ